MSSVVERGKREREERERREQEILDYRSEENRKHTVSWFRRDFYDDPSFRIPNPDRAAYARTVENPEHPYPEVTDWRLIEEGYFADAMRFASSFVCEGVRYVCRWRFEGNGGDRAYWDDGWWPEWFVVIRRRSRRFPLVRVRREVRVYGPTQVAEAVS